MSYEDDCRRARDLFGPAQFAEIDALLEIWQSQLGPRQPTVYDEPNYLRLRDRIERARRWCQS
jgi:hypothetical protein